MSEDDIDLANQQVVPNYSVSESADKISLKSKVVRGNGTRDQDKTTIKTKGSDPQETTKRHDATIQAFLSLGTGDTLRETQPNEDDE